MAQSAVPDGLQVGSFTGQSHREVEDSSDVAESDVLGFGPWAEADLSEAEPHGAALSSASSTSHELEALRQIWWVGRSSDPRRHLFCRIPDRTNRTDPSLREMIAAEGSRERSVRNREKSSVTSARGWRWRRMRTFLWKLFPFY